MFGMVRVVLMGGSAERMATIATALVPQLGLAAHTPANISRSERRVTL